MGLSEHIRGVAQLQKVWVKENTPAMQERAELIRRAIPESILACSGELGDAIGEFRDELEVQGSDGIGNKTAAPWVRLFSSRLSPRATVGMYVVLHFSTDGKKCFFTLGTSVNSWNTERGDLVGLDPAEIDRRTAWIIQVVEGAGFDLSGYRDDISIGSTLVGPKRFEQGTAICRAETVEDLTDEQAISNLVDLLRFLRVVYAAVDRREHLASSESILIEAEAAVSERRRSRSQSQGRGLTSEQRRAVETRAMRVVEAELRRLGYAIEDTSRSKPYDFEVEIDGVKIKIEVKGTTSAICDAVQMTRNEVELHRSEVGATGLGIVAGIRLQGEGENLEGVGGQLELRIPWDISGWRCEPTSYLVRRCSEAPVDHGAEVV